MSPRASRVSALLLALLLVAGCTTAQPGPSSPDATGALTPSPAGTSSGDPTDAPASSDPTTASPSAAPTTPPPPTPEATPSGTTYVVQRGDTLYRIGLRFGTTTVQLQAWNAARYPALAADAGRLEAGWELKVADVPGVTPAPTPVVTPPASPRPSIPPPVGGLGCTAGTRSGSGVVTYARIPNAGAEVALTFDMGGRMDPAVDIMSFLVANEVCATIFATGVMAQSPQGQQVMAIIRSHPELFEVGNHTMHHCDLVRGGSGSPTTAPCQTGGPPTADFIRAQLTDAEAILRAGTGQNPQPYWRPPYGSINDAVTSAAASVGYTQTFLWDIDAIDWKPESQGGPTAQQIAAKVITKAQGGSNVLFHLGGYNTLDAIRIIVPGLRQRGLTVTSLSDLLDGS